MRRVIWGSCIAGLAAVAGGCILPQFPEGATGCNPQVPLTYRIQAAIPFGILEVVVVDAADAPLASRSVTAIRTGYATQCVSAVHGTTGADGKVVFERLKTGAYMVWLDSASGSAAASQSAIVAEGQTTAIKLAAIAKP